MFPYRRTGKRTMKLPVSRSADIYIYIYINFYKLVGSVRKKAPSVARHGHPPRPFRPLATDPSRSRNSTATGCFSRGENNHGSTGRLGVRRVEGRATPALQGHEHPLATLKVLVEFWRRRTAWKSEGKKCMESENSPVTGL